MKPKYINVSSVKRLAKKNGKRISKGFLEALDVHIHLRLMHCCQDHNGGRKTLDAGIAHMYIGKA